ncbi:hypothetical protein GF312_00960 [Candidatus Poribacteria bacterium]|nr:hypothetical protein [Candidatus Poribacteria bacterium]
MPETAIQIYKEHYVKPPDKEKSEGLSQRVVKLRKLNIMFTNKPDPTERGQALMDSYDETRAESVIIRRAKTVAKILETKSLLLDD